MEQTQSSPRPPDVDDEHVGTPGTYLINAAYIVLFFAAYLFMFFELSHRWPVR
jgi:hypothetical protein